MFEILHSMDQAAKMPVLLYAEINLLCIAVLAIILVNAVRLSFDSSAKKITFVSSVSLALAASAFDLLWNLLLSTYGGRQATLLWVINFLYFVTFGLSAWFWYWYCKALRQNSIWKNRITLSLSFLPLAVLVVLLIATRFNGCLFYFDENGNHVWGKLFYLQQILTYGYAVVASLQSLFALLRRSRRKRDETQIALLVAVPPLICATLQLLFQHMPILGVGTMLSFLITFINYLQLVISADPLTGIQNRRAFLGRLDNLTEGLRRGKRLYLIFMDINAFKEINDTKGHDYGDRVLRTVADALTLVCMKADAFCGRFGGDEFVMAEILEESGDIGKTVTALHEAVEECRTLANFESRFTVSIGTAEYRPGADTVDTLISRADSSMYHEKRKRTH